MKDDSVFLGHILECIRRIEEYVVGLTREDFNSNRMVQDAVFRNIEVIGEASKNLTAAFKTKHSVIPWKDIIGMRDKLIHQYNRVDYDAVWDTIHADLPVLKNQIASILSESPKL